MKIYSAFMKPLCMATALCFLFGACNPEPVELSENPAVTPTKTFRPTQTELPTETATPTTAPVPETVILDAALSSDGKHLAVLTNTGVFLYDALLNKKRILREFETSVSHEPVGISQPGAIAISPDGESIAVARNYASTQISILNFDIGERDVPLRIIPNGYYVTQLQYSPDGKLLFVRSEYPQSIHCTDNGTDTNFAVHNVELTSQGKRWVDVPPSSKLFELDTCVKSDPYSKAQFVGNNKLFLLIQQEFSSPLGYLVEIRPSSTNIVYQFEDESTPYDMSFNGKYYAYASQNANGEYLTKLVDAETSSTLLEIPNKVKLLDDPYRFIAQDSTSGLWTMGGVFCHYDDHFDPLAFDWKTNTSHEVFFSYRSKNEIVIWNIHNCYFDTIITVSD